MSSELKQLTEELKHFRSVKPKDQAAFIGTLVSEVAVYVESIKKEQELVKKISQLRTRVGKSADTEEERREQEEDKEALRAAQDAERNISEKRVYLSKLEQAVNGLLIQIRRSH